MFGCKDSNLRQQPQTEKQFYFSFKILFGSEWPSLTLDRDWRGRAVEEDMRQGSPRTGLEPGRAPLKTEASAH